MLNAGCLNWRQLRRFMRKRRQFRKQRIHRGGSVRLLFREHPEDEVLDGRRDTDERIRLR